MRRASSVTSCQGDTLFISVSAVYCAYFFSNSHSYQDYKNKNWLQFLFIVKAAVLKQQISKFYPQIQRYYGFAKVGNFNFRSGLEAHCASYAKFREDTLNHSGDIADFRFFKMAAGAILDFGNFTFLTVGTLRRVECVCVPTFVEIDQTAAAIWPFFTFSRWRPSAILDFQNL